MKTTKEYREKVIAGGSEIHKELLDTFYNDEKILIADIGSCDGLSSVIYGRIFPNAIIEAYEPLKENIAEIGENFAEYGLAGRSFIYPYAVGINEGESIFWQSYGQAPGITGHDTGNKSSSLLPPRKHILEHTWCDFRRVKVNVRRLDSLGTGPIDFAHIDVQGAEMQVLVSGRNRLSKCRMIWIEVANVDLYKNQPLRVDITRYMENCGYYCAKDTCGDHGKYGDMLWVRI